MTKLGDKIYVVKTRMNLNQEKLKMTDADGNEWYRYSAPMWAYQCEEHTVVAIATPVLQCLEGYDFEHIDTDIKLYTDKDAEAYEDCLDDTSYHDPWFTDRVFAEQYILERSHEANQ